MQGVTEICTDTKCGWYIGEGGYADEETGGEDGKRGRWGSTGGHDKDEWGLEVGLGEDF